MFEILLRFKVHRHFWKNTIKEEKARFAYLFVLIVIYACPLLEQSRKSE